MTLEYFDYNNYLTVTDTLVFFDLILYMMLILVLMNVIFSWLPQVFGSLLDLFGRYLNLQVSILFIISVVMMLLFSFLRMTLAGQFLYNMSSVLNAMIRNLMMFCGGYFLESNLSMFGIKENLDTLNDYGLSF